MKSASNKKGDPPLLNCSHIIKLGLILTVAVMSPGSAQTAIDHADPKMQALARQEGTVVWYESGPLEAMQAVARDFETDNPGIRVVVQRIVGVAQYQRFVMETQAHQNIADVLSISDQPRVCSHLNSYAALI